MAEAECGWWRMSAVADCLSTTAAVDSPESVAASAGFFLAAALMVESPAGVLAVGFGLAAVAAGFSAAAAILHFRSSPDQIAVGQLSQIPSMTRKCYCTGSDFGEALRGDRLILRGLKFYGFHGAIPEEKKLGQTFMVDVDAWMDLQPAGKSDCLSHTISYVDIFGIVQEVVQGISHDLVESVAELIASTSLGKYPKLSAIRVKIGKLNVAAVHGVVDYLGIEIIRYQATDVKP